MSNTNEIDVMRAMALMGDDEEDGDFDPNEFFSFNEQGGVEVKKSDDSEFDESLIFNPSAKKEVTAESNSLFKTSPEAVPDLLPTPPTGNGTQPPLNDHTSVVNNSADSVIIEHENLSQRSQPHDAFISSDPNINDSIKLTQPTEEELVRTSVDQLKTIGKELSQDEINETLTGNRKQQSGGVVLADDEEELVFTKASDEEADKINLYKNETLGGFPNQDSESTSSYDYGEPPEHQDSQYNSSVQENYNSSQQNASRQPALVEVPKFEGKLIGNLAAANSTTKILPCMINLDNFEHKAKATGDVYIEKAELVPYGEGKVRAVFDLIVADKKKLKGTLFEVTSVMTKELMTALKGNVMKVTGNWNLFNGKKEYTIRQYSMTNDTVAEDFVDPPSNDDFLEYDQMYEIMYNSISKSGVKAVLDVIMNDYGYRDKMRNGAAAKTHHDNKKGGLWKHSVKVAYITYMCAAMYPDVDRDIAVVGALLHDIGKAQELVDGEYTVTGSLIGHIPLGYDTVKDACKIAMQREPSLTNNDALNITHIIISHHGSLEWGSPATPKTPEAILVFTADYQESRMQNAKETLEGEVSAFSRMHNATLFDLRKVQL